MKGEEDDEVGDVDLGQIAGLSYPRKLNVAI